MVRMTAISAAAFALAAFGALGAVTISSSPAEAVVYCKTVGVPKGCVARPAAPVRAVYCTAPGVPVGCVVHPATKPHVVYCKRRGVPKGCVMR
jgi:hypothetical protein